MVRHRWILQDGKACLLASWFLSRDVAVHSGVVGDAGEVPRWEGGHPRCPAQVAGGAGEVVGTGR